MTRVSFECYDSDHTSMVKPLETIAEVLNSLEQDTVITSMFRAFEFIFPITYASS